jgi:hypothetical protein
LTDEIKTWLESTNEVVDSMNDYSWLIDLAFLAYVTQNLKTLNLELQGMDKRVVDMISAINAFKNNKL